LHLPLNDRPPRPQVPTRPDPATTDSVTPRGALTESVVVRGRPGLPWAAVAAAWPLRRVGAVAVGAPILMVLVITVAGRPVGAPGWTVLAGLVALTTAMTLATYLPPRGSGTRLVLGCTPCATVAALSVPVAIVVLSTSSHDVPTAILALGAAAFGLRQRLTDPQTCPA